MIADKKIAPTVEFLESAGILLRSADGSTLYSRRKIPHRHVDIRGSGNRFQIICSTTGENRGENRGEDGLHLPLVDRVGSCLVW